MKEDMNKTFVPREENPLPQPEVQIIPKQTPEIKRIPPDIAQTDVDDFLNRQQKEDERKKDRKGSRLNS